METISTHLSKELRMQYKRRALSLRKGDEVKIIHGENVGKTGTVENVDTKNAKIAISGIKVKRTIGTEKELYIEPMNVVITNLDLSDKMRQKILLRKVKEVKVPQAPEPKKEEVVEAKEKKVETKEKVNEEKKHAHEKAPHAKVLAHGKKKGRVGGRTKARPA